MNDLDLQNVGNPNWDRLKPEQRAQVADRVMRRTQKAEPKTPVREPARPAQLAPEYVEPLLIAQPDGEEGIPVLPAEARKKLARLTPGQRVRAGDRIERRMDDEVPSNRPPEEPAEVDVMPAFIAAEVPAEYVAPLLINQVDEEQELANVPVEVRNKLARLQPEGMERVKDRVRQRVRGESAKKLERIRQEEDAKANEIMKLAPTTEIFDRQEYPGGWPAPARTIPTRSRFTPQAPNKLVDIPVDLQQTIKNEIVEEHGIPPDEADVIASNAIDRWTEISRETPTPTSDEEAKMIAEAYQPAFMIEKLPGNLGELPDAMQAIVDDAKSLGWKSLVPLALGAGVLVLLLRKR